MFKRFIAFLVGITAVCALGANSAPTVRGLLLDAAKAGGAIIAVGERGTILRSTDSGQTWESIATPASATLTGISFVDSERGWAVGHDGVILYTRDGGQSWAEQHNNIELSFLDVIAIDLRRAIAVGAFGAYFITSDGGHTWTQKKALEEDLHLNRITMAADGRLFIAGERGTLLLSKDHGHTYVAVPTPYEGSFFGVLPADANLLLAYGLRGHAFRSDNAEIAWQPIEVPQPTLVSTAVKLASGTIVLAGQARGFYVSLDNGLTFKSWNPGLTTPVAELLEAPDGTLLAFGESGCTRLPSPE